LPTDPSEAVRILERIIGALDPLQQTGIVLSVKKKFSIFGDGSAERGVSSIRLNQPVFWM